MNPVLLAAEKRWTCPNCDAWKLTREQLPHTPFHPCRGLKGLTAPLVEVGTKCKVEAQERGDWVGDEVVQTDADGRPWQAVVTTRDDGVDCAVLAPMAQGQGEPR